MNILPFFDPVAKDYDQWYDTTEGNIIFQEELQCLQSLCSDYRGRWMEVGVGTGRFATALGIAYGIDLSFQMVKPALRRGVGIAVARAEQVPLRNASLDSVLIQSCSALFRPPDHTLAGPLKIVPGIAADAGFTGLLFDKAGPAKILPCLCPRDIDPPTADAIG